MAVLVLDREMPASPDGILGIIDEYLRDIGCEKSMIGPKHGLYHYDAQIWGKFPGTYCTLLPPLGNVIVFPLAPPQLIPVRVKLWSDDLENAQSADPDLQAYLRVQSMTSLELFRNLAWRLISVIEGEGSARRWADSEQSGGALGGLAVTDKMQEPNPTAPTDQAGPEPPNATNGKKPPRVPKRAPDLARWRAVWRYIRPDVERGHTDVQDLLGMLARKTDTEHLGRLSEDIMRDIIAAGVADLLNSR